MLEEEQYPRTSGELAPEQLLQFYEQFEVRPMNCENVKISMMKDGTDC